MEAMLENNSFNEFFDQEIPKPTTSDAQNLAEWKKCVAKARQIILEGVRDHIVLSLHGKETLSSMRKTLTDLYQNRAIKVKKGKEKSSQSKSDSYHGGKKKEMMNVKCFHGHELGHFATNCPLNKSKNKSLGGVAGEALACQFELGLSLIVCMVSSMMGSVWYLESGASFHMTSNKELFNDLEEKYLHMHVEMGDDGNYSVTKLGTVTLRGNMGI
eukprot:PITA_34156